MRRKGYVFLLFVFLLVLSGCGQRGQDSASEMAGAGKNETETAQESYDESAIDFESGTAETTETSEPSVPETESEGMGTDETKEQDGETGIPVVYMTTDISSQGLMNIYQEEGGDSRKQVTMIFALALFGCVVFTVYASGLFFRKKSKQLGTLMALGASRRRLAPGLFREVLLLSSLSSLLGIAAGFPFVFLLWNGFRLPQTRYSLCHTATG